MKQKTTEHLCLCCAVISILAMLIFCGCAKSQDEPAKKEGYVEIMLDWSGDPRPQTARFLIYDLTGKLIKETSGVTSVFKGTLPEGKYRIVVHNTDAGQVDYRGIEKYETAEVFAQETHYTNLSPVKTLTRHDPSLPCILEPQSVFGTGSCQESEIVSISADNTTKVTVKPILLTKDVEFHFSVKSSEAVKSVTGILGGISPGIFLASGEHNTTSSCAMEFAAAAGTKAGSDEFMARLCVFNLLVTPDSPAGTSLVDIKLTLESGVQLETTFDMTSTLQQIINDNNGSIPLEIPIEVTLETKGIGGLSASVRPWDESGSGSGDPRPLP